MNRRSRKGCIDCKRAKVKCDEERPTCGTCHRRGYQCQGYVPVPKPAAIRTQIHKQPAAQVQVQVQSLKVQPPYSKSEPPQTPALVPEAWLQQNPGQTPAQPPRRRNSEAARDGHETAEENGGKKTGGGMEMEELATEDNDVFSPDLSYTSNQITRIARARASSFSSSCPPLYPTISTVPPSAIQSTDQGGVEIYFSRHPSELVISAEFINEMNANVWQVFQEDPAAVAETLSAIGHVYLGEGGLSIVPVLDRKQRILARLRDRRDLEQMLVMLLGLCALELIDNRSEPCETSLPAILSNAAIIINHQISAGLPISSVAKYFIRALARQDMMVSLTYARHTLIPSAVWLSDETYRTADRFMGYTGTLMPILADLSALAEEIRGGRDVGAAGASAGAGGGMRFEGEVWSEEAIMLSTNPTLAIYQKMLSLRQRLTNWRPIPSPSLSFTSSRNLLFHAHSHRAAALLYLHRLLEPPGSSEAADQVALGMAHEVLMHLSAMTDQLKTALWPLLIAGTELTEEGDREVVRGMFDQIVGQRKTVTARRTREFCVERVWGSRDRGEVWNWMELVGIWPGECLPI